MSGIDPSAPVPRCYLHPDRETYISCTRCSRPICPDCMTSAPVGFQCPECVREGRASTPTVTTAVGARPAERPVVTIALIGICVVAYALEWVGGLQQVTRSWGMFPPAIGLEGEIYRLLTSVFLHGSLIHIGFNMLVLWMLGPQLERVLGHVRFLLLYLLAGIGGAVASYLFSPPLTLSVGASGAIFGLMGALVVAGRRLGHDVRQVLVLLAINVVIGFLPGGGIDWRAHLGGLVVGAATAAVLVFAPRSNRVLWQSLGLLAIVGALVVLTMWRTAQIHALLAPALPS